MPALQYEITLPADYDMGIRRAALGGHRLPGRGPARGAVPRALLTAVPVTGLDVAARMEDLEILAGHPDVHTAALAVDPYRWQLLRFVLWRDAVAPAESDEAALRRAAPLGAGAVRPAVGADLIAAHQCWSASSRLRRCLIPSSSARIAVSAAVDVP